MSILLRLVSLGGFELWCDGKPVTKLEAPHYQALLIYLVLHADRPQPRQNLAFTFWADSTEAQARTNLRKALYHLRRALPEVDLFLQIDRQTVMWRRDGPYQLDAADFVTAVSRAQEAPTASIRQKYLNQAIARYSGEFLPGHYDDWILARRELLRQQYLACLSEQIQLLENGRDYVAAVSAAQKLLHADPLHEATYRRLMRLQTLNGNRAGALRTYHTCTTTLQRELGVAPSAVTQEVYRRLLAVESMPERQQPARIPLVGRQKPWSMLQKTWQQAVRKQPLFTLIRGEAGIGKTRLAEELLEWSSRQGFTTLRAASHAPASSLPYAPITAWLRDANVQKRLSSLPDKWLREISRILPELLADHPALPPPDPITESWQRQHLFTALAHAILHQPQPILLFLDDLQWCDTDTLAWLCFLLHFDPQARFLLLGTVRNEEISNGHPVTALATRFAARRQPR